MLNSTTRAITAAVTVEATEAAVVEEGAVEITERIGEKCSKWL